MEASSEEYLKVVDGVPAEIFVPPSKEARLLLKILPWFVSPKDLRGGPIGRFLRTAMVAPFTQMTFFSFDLQAFLLGVFHQTWSARIGHFVGMNLFNFFIMAALCDYHMAGAPMMSLGAGYAFFLALWYTILITPLRLWGWLTVSCAVLVVQALGATSLAPILAETQLWYANPWFLAAMSAVLIMISHAPEEKIPPRAVPGFFWMRPLDFIFGVKGQRNSPGKAFKNGARIGSFLIFGAIDEAWASPRLMPYTHLMLMMHFFGYQPSVYALLDDRVQRALELGNPAVDYVGVGGGTFLKTEGLGQQDR